MTINDAVKMVDALKLRDCRCLVTGAGSGIGRAAAGALAALGARVMIVDQASDAAEAVAAELAGLAVWRAADVTDSGSVEAAFAAVDRTWGGVDVVINAAGVMRAQGTAITELDLGTWESVLAVNLTGAFIVAQAAARRFIPANGGTLILVGSGGGVEGASGSIPYGASKGGVNGLAMTLAHHLAPHGIRVHNFAPGTVDTPLLRKSLGERLGSGASSEQIEQAVKGATPVEDVGFSLAMLASPRAAALRGNIFTR